MKSRAEVSGRSRTESRLLKLLLLGFVGAAISGTALVGFALGDTLELRTGQIVQGRFVGGSPLNIRFEVDGKEQIFATKDVLNIGFSDVSDASSAPAPPACSSCSSCGFGGSAGASCTGRAISRRPTPHPLGSARRARGKFSGATEPSRCAGHYDSRGHVAARPHG